MSDANVDDELTSDERRILAWMRFLLGLPAVVIAVITIAIVLFAREVPQKELIEDYANAASVALENDQARSADLYYRKLLSLEPSNQEYQYQLALTALELKGDQRAWALMSKIAPDNSIGYGQAHLWQALQLYQVARKPNPPAETVDRLEHHLLCTIKRMDEHDRANMILGQLYLAKAQFESDPVLLEKSLQHLAAGVESFPENRLSVAELHRRLGRPDRAKSEAEASLLFYQAKLKADPNDIDARLRVATAFNYLAKFGSSIKTLTEGLKFGDDPQLRKSLASTYLMTVRALSIKEPKNVGRRLELLQAALQLDPENQLILSSFAAMTAQSGEVAARAKEVLQGILEKGEAPATVHLILGTIAMQREQDKEASYHLNQALKLNPKMPEVLNNLAWHLAFGDEPKLDRALQLANRAIELRPGSIEIYETRGQILLKLNRHQDALKDLLLALRKLPDRAEIHASLAEIYEHLGDQEMAQRHQKRANDAKARQLPSVP